MENQNTPIASAEEWHGALLKAFTEPEPELDADGNEIVAEGPLKPLLPHSQEIEMIDSSTNNDISMERKIASFKLSVFNMLDKTPLNLLATLVSTLRTTDGLINLVDTKRLEMMNATEDEEQREAIQYNFNIDVLIDRAYGIVDALTSLRGELGEGQSLRPIHDAAIELSAVGLALANSLVVGMEVTDNPGYQPAPEETPAQ